MGRQAVISIPALNLLAKRLSKNFSHINRGGCCVIAYLMYEKLFGLVDNLKIVFLDDYIPEVVPTFGELLNTHRNLNVSVLNNNGYGCTHAVILFDYKGVQYCFDTDYGATPFEFYPSKFKECEYVVDIPIEVARIVAKKDIGWNWFFRRYQIPDIKKTIESFTVTK